MSRNSRVNQTAIFALGWFWGPDSRFGSLDGVYKTLVGYCGGTTPKPTYRSLGDHSEAVRILFDSQQVSYLDLLNEFWAQHNPISPVYSNQYRSAIFYTSDDQQFEAEHLKATIEKQQGYTIYTSIEPAAEFYPAEDYHQKYYLQRHYEMMEVLTEIYPDKAELFESTLATKLNAIYSGNAGLIAIRRVFQTADISNEFLDKIEYLLRQGQLASGSH